MTTGRSQIAAGLLKELLARPPEERTTHLDNTCGNDMELRREVELLLRRVLADDSMGGPPADDTDERHSIDSVIGRRVGPYTITTFLGGGGMGRVFLAEDESLQRRVAVKILNPRALRAGVRPEQLLREARAVAQLNHPQIAQVHHVIEENGETYIVMEYLQGETLAERLRRVGPLPAQEVIDVGIQIAHAVAHAHSRNVLHCDLKPENVFLTHQGTVKVMDFGIARLLDPGARGSAMPIGASETLLARRPGTPGYMSPEQQRGDALDERSDVFSIGVLLNELATGRQLRSEPDSDVSSAPGGGDAARGWRHPLRDIVRRAAATEPVERYASAAMLADALEDIRRSLDRRSAVLRRRLVVYGAAVIGGVVSLVSLVVDQDAAPLRGAAVPVAILPVTTDVADDETRMLAASVRPIVAAALSSLPGVTVVPSDAAIPTGGAPPDPFVTGRTLGVQYLVTGAVRQTPTGIAMTIELLNVESKASIWRSTFTGRREDVLELEQKAAAALVDRLQSIGVTPRLSAAERRVANAPATWNPEALAEYSQGLQFLERRDAPANIDHAIKLLTSAARKDPNFALAHAALGTAFWNKYQATKDAHYVDSARAAMLEALRIEPASVDVRYALADVYYGTGRRAESRQELERILEARPHHDAARALMANIHEDEGDFEAAVAQLRTAIAARPQYWVYYASLGRIYYSAGKYDDAIAAFTRVTELRPDSSFGYQMRGTTHHMRGELTEAERDYLQANAIAPSANATLNLAAIYEQRGQLSRAQQMYEQAITLNPNVPAAYVNLGDVRQRLRLEDAAREAFARAIEAIHKSLAVNPNDGGLIALLAVCEAKLGRHAEATKIIGRAIALRPTDREVRFQAAEVKSLGGRPREALTELELALASGYSPELACSDPDLAAVRRLDGALDKLKCQ